MRLKRCATLIPSLLRDVGVTALLLICCGCPANSPSQEEQRQNIPFHWITVEPAASEDDERRPAILEQQDVEAIVAQVPTISVVVEERVQTVMIVSGDAELEVQICGTGPEYLQLLTDATGAEIKHGRFLQSVDAYQAASVIVLDDDIADRLFGVVVPVDATVGIGEQTLTVIGVVGGRHESLTDDLDYDAYMPRELLTLLDSTQNSPTQLNRIRVRVESLDQVEDTRTVIRELIERRHPGVDISVR
jgi:hypothetical protein